MTSGGGGFFGFGGFDAVGGEFGGGYETFSCW